MCLRGEQQKNEAQVIREHRRSIVWWLEQLLHRTIFLRYRPVDDRRLKLRRSFNFFNLHKVSECKTHRENKSSDEVSDGRGEKPQDIVAGNMEWKIIKQLRRKINKKLWTGLDSSLAWLLVLHPRAISIIIST